MKQRAILRKKSVGVLEIALAALQKDVSIACIAAAGKWNGQTGVVDMLS